MSVCYSARLAWSLGVCCLSTWIVQRRLLSTRSQVVCLSVDMGKARLGVHCIAQQLSYKIEHA